MGDRVLEIVRDPARLHALRVTGLLDSPPEEAFDRITRLAADLLGTRGSLVTLLDEDRQFFKSSHGLPEPWASRGETPLSHSYCKFVVADGAAFVVEDAREHPRVKDSPAIEDLGVLAYAGVPLRGPDGQLLGSFAVFHDEPREWKPDQVELMEVLASSVEGAIWRAAIAESTASPQEGPDPFVPYRTMVEDLPLGLILHRAGEVLWMNREAARIVGVDEPEGAVGMSLLQFVTEEERERVSAQVRRVQEERKEISLQRYRVAGLDGVTRMVEAMAVPVELQGDPLVQVAVRDVSRLHETEAKFSHLFQLTPLAVAVSTLEDGRFVEVNPSFEELVGYGRDELLGQSALDLNVWADPGERRQAVERLRETGRVKRMEVGLQRASGELLDVLLFAERVELEGEPHVFWISYDITERKRLERELERQALHDALTDLPNRALFEDRLEHAFAQLPRRDENLAVFYLDLDRFKVVNDTLGHAGGDQLLQRVAHRLSESVREGDTVARLGGDEFAVLLEVHDRDEAGKVADRVIEAFADPFSVLETDVHVDASIGIAMASDELESSQDLLRFGDVAMYQAKGETDTGYVFFDPDRDAVTTRRLHRENELRRAIEEEQFEVHYQPLIELPGGEIVGAEALVRWRHPERGLLAPGEFIGLAEETGLIVPLGKWVLRTAARQAADWREAEPGADVGLSVNLSARQFQDPGLVEEVEAVLGETGLPEENLTLEITESVAIQGTGRVEHLRELGVRLAVDDFGTGYSSLEYLRRLNVDALKVDRIFIEGFPEEPTDEAMVRAIFLVAGEMGLEVVAEGIETPRQLESLRELGCHVGQGYYFSRPVPAGEFLELCERTPEW